MYSRVIEFILLVGVVVTACIVIIKVANNNKETPK